MVGTLVKYDRRCCCTGTVSGRARAMNRDEPRWFYAWPVGLHYDTCHYTCSQVWGVCMFTEYIVLIYAILDLYLHLCEHAGVLYVCACIV